MDAGFTGREIRTRLTEASDTYLCQIHGDTDNIWIQGDPKSRPPSFLWRSTARTFKKFDTTFCSWL